MSNLEKDILERFGFSEYAEKPGTHMTLSSTKGIPQPEKTAPNFVVSLYPVNFPLNDVYSSMVRNNTRFDRVLVNIDRECKKLEKRTSLGGMIYIAEFIEDYSRSANNLGNYQNIRNFMQCTKAMAKGELYVCNLGEDALDYKDVTKGLQKYKVENPYNVGNSKKLLLCKVGRNTYKIEEKNFNKRYLWDQIVKLDGQEFEPRLAHKKKSLEESLLESFSVYDTKLPKIKEMYGLDKDMVIRLERING